MIKILRTRDVASTTSLVTVARAIGVRLKEHKYNFKHGLIGKQKSAQHAYDEGDGIT
jgi:hypothetical protein